VCVTPLAAGAPAEALWHLDSTKLTLYFLTYNGVTTINTHNGPVNVLDFTAASADVDSMVTDSVNPVGGKNDYANGGQGQTVHLTNVHLHVLKQTGNLLGLIPVTLAPGSPDMAVIGLTEGIPLPIAWFTDTHVDQYTLTADTLSVPGFDIHQDH
jgi:hypothetical protein